jgi:hypothetical protein
VAVLPTVIRGQVLSENPTNLPDDDGFEIAEKSLARLASRYHAIQKQIDDTGRIVTTEVTMDMQPNLNTARMAQWRMVFKTGVVFMFLGTTFVMVLIVMAIPLSDRQAVLVALFAALTMSVGTLCMTGTAFASGSIPVPLRMKGHPITFTVTGGIAVFVIVFLLIYWALKHA